MMGKKKKKKKHPQTPRRKRMKREGRLQSARGWIPTYEGNDLVRGYSRWFGVDRLTAVVELKQLGVPNLEEREAHERKCVELRAKQNARRKEKRREREAEEELFFSDSDDTFAYIAGYTSGGAPFGVTWEEAEAPEKKTGQPRTGTPGMDDSMEIPF